MFDWKNNQVFFSAEMQGTSSAQEQQEKKRLSNNSNLALALLSALQREAQISFSGVTSLFLSLFF